MISKEGTRRDLGVLGHSLLIAGPTSRSAKKLMVVQNLCEDGRFEDVAIQLRPEVPELLVGSEVVVPQEEANFQEILRYIDSDKNGIIGIWGMGGVGKTRLLHLVHNHYKENSAFDVVVKVTASKECSVEKLQKELCENCGLDRGNSTEKSIILNYLTKRNFLILLDDLWGQIYLEKVGIPLGLGNRLKKKIVITTRSKKICGLMGVNKSLKVEGLDHENALRLFNENVGGETIQSHPLIPSLAEKVVKELGGLPLALITVGKSMSDKIYPSEWNHAIDRLEKSGLNELDEEKIFHQLKLSYDSLNTKKLKDCFLVCSLWPEDYSIEKTNLIECWLGLGFLDLDISDARNIYNPGYDVIRKLLSACLLEEVGSEYVKMHDVIRDMALWIARGEDKENDKWVVLDGLDQMRHKNIRWSDVERASLISYELMVPMNGKELPLNPYEYDELISDGSDEWEGVPLIPCDATRLQFVRVRSGYPFTATIDALVQNVSIFRDLEFLELRNCDLYSFPQGISQLVKLEHLNLENNHIKSVPDELKHVRNLRFLSLGYNSISLFPKGVLPELKELMVLDIYNINRGSSEDGEEQYWTCLINELRCLSKLRCLSINLQQPAHFRNLLELSNLPVRTLFLHYKNETDTLEIPSSFIGKVQDNLYKLELKVRSVRKLLFGSNYQSRLGNLEFLSFLMYELEMIEWPWNVAPEDLLPMLHDLFLECWRILDVSWTLYLPCLRTLKLFRCVHIVQLFEPVGGCGSGAIKPTFPSLIRLELELLPEMEIICDESITFPSLEEITIHKCPKLKKLPFQSRGKLKTIKIESECWERLEWEDNDLKQDLQGLVRDLWRRR
ncbi:Disease resistance protein RPS5 [Rhynchospora pubera]|uniref:Disease resistance protein RPS5 n=1 Tax=Rhynchospora pubera TaxID=906938 RepID=A0AAV8D0G4_9POAL|nr:Disease resistance protein RPS5 [Rhynchospora pubera]